MRVGGRGVGVSGDIPLWRWGNLGHPGILGDPARILFLLLGICSPNPGLKDGSIPVWEEGCQEGSWDGGGEAFSSGFWLSLSLWWLSSPGKLVAFSLSLPSPSDWFLW